MKRQSSLQPVYLPLAEIEPIEIRAPEEVIFDPEAGKASDNPFDTTIQYEVEETITVIHDYESMTVQDLKGILRQRELTLKGKKADLIARLEASDKEAATAAPNDEEDPVDAVASDKEVSKYEGEPAANSDTKT
jgi:hypothetical protein